MDCHYPTAEPIVSFINSDMSEEDANALAERVFLTFEQLVRDYADQPMIVGVEINEFWPMDNHPDKQWEWILKMGNTFANAYTSLIKTY